LSKWSAVSVDKWLAWLKEAKELYDVFYETGKARRFHPIAAAIAGALLVRSVCDMMDGDIRWWLRFIEHGTLDGVELPPDAIPNWHRSGGST